MKFYARKCCALLTAIIFALFFTSAAMAAMPAIQAGDMRNNVSDGAPIQENPNMAYVDLLNSGSGWSGVDNVPVMRTVGDITYAYVLYDGHQDGCTLAKINCVSGSVVWNLPLSNSHSSMLTFQLSTPLLVLGEREADDVIYAAVGNSPSKVVKITGLDSGLAAAVEVTDVICDIPAQINTPITTDDHGEYIYFGTWVGNGSIHGSSAPGEYYQISVNDFSDVQTISSIERGFYWAGAVFSNGYAYFGGDGGRLYCRPVGSGFGTADISEILDSSIELEPINGNEPGDVRSALRLHEEKLYFTSKGSSRGNFYCYTIESDGIPRFSYGSVLQGNSTSTPVISPSGEIYVGYYTGFTQGGIAEVSTDTPYSVISGFPVQCSILLYSTDMFDYLFFTSNNGTGAGHCYEYDHSGMTREVWKTAEDTYSLAGMAYDNGFMVFGNDFNHVCIVGEAINVDDYPDNLNTTARLSLNADKHGQLESTSDIDCFVFTPPETGSYKIYTTGLLNTKGILYDSNQLSVLSTSYGAPGTSNFCLARTLERGKNYYVKLSSETADIGSYTVKVNRLAEPRDSRFSEQWSLLNRGGASGTAGLDINVLPVWEYTKGAGVTIGILDTGVDTSHIDLAPNISTKIPGYNFVYENDVLLPSDDPHGTHVAGIAAAASNATGIIGVAPEAKIVPMALIQVPRDDSQPAYKDVLIGFKNAIKYCNDKGIDILNCSFWWENGSETSQAEVKQSIINSKNLLLVVAAGNAGLDISNRNYRPATNNTWNMINVANLTNTGSLSSGSNYGDNVHLAAPGTDILSCVLENKYNSFNGTSLAAPQVAGVAALLKSYYPQLTVSQLKSMLIDPDNVSFLRSLNNKVTSNGLVNAWAAFNANPDRTRLRNTELSRYTLDDNTKETILTAVTNGLQKYENNLSDFFTTQIFVNIDDSVNKEAFIKNVSPNAVKISDEELTGSVLLEYGSIQDAITAVRMFNEYDIVNYAEPLYNVKINIGY